MGLTVADAEHLQALLEGEGIAVLPTDTVYGAACNPHSKRAVERLYALKRRPARKPSAVMFFALGPALAALPELGPRTRAALQALLPGPVTLLLPNSQHRFGLACVGGPRSLLGVRVPLFDGPAAPLAEVSVPALQSSANLSGGPEPRRLEDVPAELRKGADLVLDGGGLPGTASTVIDLSTYESDGTWRLVRDGPVDRPGIQRLLNG